MPRSLTVALGLLLLAWLGFEVYPGHTYLASSSQLYLPMLERLAAPGYLSRDLVATYPSLTYTVYDEVTLFLHEAGKFDFRQALEAQQFLFRLAGVVGVFLLGRAAGLRELSALLVSALLNLGSFLPGPDIALIDPEPVPRAFAFGLVLLAMGCLAREKPLLSGLSGGLALLYDPVLVSPFWIVILASFAFDCKLRKLLRPVLPILLVFVLMLANLAQLQPGTADSEPLLSRLSEQVRQIQRFRVPELWVSFWARGLVHLYLALFVIAIWATIRIWPALNRQLRWFLVLLPLIGLLSVPFSYVLLDRSHWALIPPIKPAQTVAFTVAIAWLACAIAGIRAIQQASWREALAWSAVCLAILVLGIGRVPRQSMTSGTVSDLGAWAESSTWGSSMFQFPDAGKALYPGVFRADSRRALWVDWESGAQTGYYPELALEWSERWHDTMQGDFSCARLQSMLSLPIDYYVLKRTHMLETYYDGRWSAPKWVFLNQEFVVYDASDLRSAPGKLQIARIHVGG